jgi:hypothetical protein
MPVLLRPCIGILLSLLANIACAEPITWVLTAKFPVGSPTILGSFTYDADTNAVLSWNIDGLASGCIGGPPCGGVRGASVSNGGTFANFFFEGSDLHTGLLLEFASPLTNAGVTTGLMPGSCVICSGPDFASGHTVSGSGEIHYVTTVGAGYFKAFEGGKVEAVPEPVVGFSTGLFALTMAAATARRLRRSLHNK